MKNAVQRNRGVMLVSDGGDFDSTAGLRAYGLPDIQDAHLVLFHALDGTVRAARRAAEPKNDKARAFVASGAKVNSRNSVFGAKMLHKISLGAAEACQVWDNHLSIKNCTHFLTCSG